MKTILLTTLFTLICLSAMNAQDYSIVGTWQATMDNETGQFIFLLCYCKNLAPGMGAPQLAEQLKRFIYQIGNRCLKLYWYND